jgi:hypothetical protein
MFLLKIELVRHTGQGVGNTEILSFFICHSKKPTDATSYSVLGQRRVGVVAQLIKACVTVSQPQGPGVEQVVWDIVTE